MKLRALGLQLTTLAFSVTSLALDRESCSDRDLSESPGLGVPLNRDGTGWCYAHSAADLISFKIKQRVSAFDLTTKFHESIRTSFIKTLTHTKTQNIIESGGNVDEVLDAASESNVCSEAELPSDYAGNDLFKYWTNVFQLQSNQLTPESCAKIKKIYPTLLVDNLKEIFSKYDGDRRIIELAKNSCKNRIPVPKFKYQTRSLKGEKDLKVLDEQLNQRNIVSFSHDMDFFLVQDYRPIKKNYNHQATIVGRRFKEGRCEYMVKGSSGKNKNFKYVSPYKENNAGGYVWVDREVLANFTDSLTYVE